MNQIEKYQAGGDSHPIFQSAAQGDLVGVRKHLEDGIDPRAENPTGPSLLAVALSPSRSFSVDLLKLLIEFGADLNRPLNRFGETPLLRAVNSGEINLVRLLVENGANVTGTETPALVGAVANGNSAIFDYLIEHGADVNESDASGRTLMHSAALANQVEMLGRLHALGLEIDAQDNKGRTPLALAAMKGAEGSVEWLVENGADPAICDRTRRNPLAWAKENGHNRVERALT